MVGPIQLSPPARSPSRATRTSAPKARQPPAAPPPLTRAEAELASRLSPILAEPPHRPGDPAPAQAIDDPDFTVRLADVLRVDGPEPAPLILPDPAIETAAGHAIKPAAPWLKQARRARWRSMARNSIPWLMTLAVIMITICGMFIALAGLPKSLELVAQAKSRIASAIAHVQQP